MELVRFGSADNLKLTELEVPKIKAGEMLVKVHASSINPVDWKIRNGSLRWIPGFGGRALPRVLGFDISGEIVTSEDHDSSWRAGDQVFGMLGVNGGGGNAEYTLVKSAQMAQKPPAMSHCQAAAVPLAGLTAWQGIRLAAVRPNLSVLLVGASGGVGSLALQMAKAKGAQVTAVCSARNADLVERLGADEVLAYDRDPIPAGRRFAVVFDAAGVWSYQRARPLLVRGGSYVTALPSAGALIGDAVGPLLSLVDRGRRIHTLWVKPDGQALAQIAQLIEKAQLTVHLERTYPLAELPDAHRHSETGRVRGKLAVQVGG